MSQHKGDSKTESEQGANSTDRALADRKTKVLPEAEVATQIAPTADTKQLADTEATTRVVAKTHSEGAEPASIAVAKETTAPSSSQDLAPGTVIKDRFVIESQLGRGGMGVVYRVKDLRKEETNDRDPYLAMKVLNDEFRRDPRMVTALQREARKAQTLAHPNITTVYDFDRDEHLVYLTMEMMQGDPLNEFIRKNPRGVPRARALEIIRGLCLGLAYAHNKNIIHSDFKPGNIFLTNDNRTKILDFGIARAAPVLHPDGSSEVTQFDAGSLSALTPAYASYEMLSGQEPHPADDVFALAIVSYQLLTGRHPFNSHPASQARAKGLVPAPIKGLKRREWRAIAHGLAFDRAQRTGHAATFLREFEGSPRIRLTLAAVASALVITSGYLVYEESRKVIANRPDVAFTELSGEVQAQFQARLQEARMLESFRDYSSALQQYKAAYQLHPRNPEAVIALEAFFSNLYTLSLQDPQANQLSVLRDNLAEVRKLDGYLANRPALKTLAETIHANE